MSNPNPFDDLAGDAEEDETTETTIENDTAVDSESQSRTDREPDTELAQSTTASSTNRDMAGEAETTDMSPERSVDGPTLQNSSPPFPYSDAEQKQMYVQDGLWDDFEDIGFDAELELRRTFDVRNVEQRELDTAVIRLVLAQLTPREIATMVIQMRGFDPSSLD